jgi:hypothetical protein
MKELYAFFIEYAESFIINEEEMDSHINLKKKSQFTSSTPRKENITEF